VIFYDIFGGIGFLITSLKMFFQGNKRPTLLIEKALISFPSHQCNVSIVIYFSLVMEIFACIPGIMAWPSCTVHFMFLS